MGSHEKRSIPPGTDIGIRSDDMKNRKICPKCNSTDIIKVPGKAGAYGVGNNIQTGWIISVAVPLSSLILPPEMSNLL